jgi:hypothetical protein
MGLIGNTIAGVFESVLFIKYFGRLGFNTASIVLFEEVNMTLFAVNSFRLLYRRSFGDITH